MGVGVYGRCLAGVTQQVNQGRDERALAGAAAAGDADDVRMEKRCVGLQNFAGVALRVDGHEDDLQLLAFVGQLALIARLGPGDARRDDLAVLGDEVAQQPEVTVGHLSGHKAWYRSERQAARHGGAKYLEVGDREVRRGPERRDPGAAHDKEDRHRRPFRRRGGQQRVRRRDEAGERERGRDLRAVEERKTFLRAEHERRKTELERWLRERIAKARLGDLATLDTVDTPQIEDNAATNPANAFTAAAGGTTSSAGSFAVASGATLNFGGGTYVLYAEIKGDIIEVDSEPYGDSFARPARLLPLEAKALVAAIDLVGDHLPQSKLDTAREKIIEALGRDPAHEGLAIVSESGGAEAARIVNEAIAKRQVLELNYYKENEDKFSERKVEPYRLENGREGWYAECFDLDRQAMRHFKLDRIKDATPTGESFEPRPEAEELAANSTQWKASGDRLRAWMGIGRDTFYDESLLDRKSVV